MTGIEYEKTQRNYKLKKGQDPMELLDHFTEANTKHEVTEPGEERS
jgi:hypothetical protein